MFGLILLRGQLDTSVKVAQKIVFQIRDRTKVRIKNPLIGKKEELLLEKTKDYRYLIVTNYKMKLFKVQPIN